MSRYTTLRGILIAIGFLNFFLQLKGQNGQPEKCNAAHDDLQVIEAYVTCSQPDVDLSVFFPIKEVHLWWFGPQGDSLSGTKITSIEKAGTFTVFARNISDGSISSRNIFVLDGRIYPKITTLGGTLDCRENELTLHTAAFPSRLAFEWSGPNGFNEKFASPTVDCPGTYVLTATDLKNGCKATDTAIVADIRNIPTAAAHVEKQISRAAPTTWIYADPVLSQSHYRCLWWSSDGYPVVPSDSIAGQVGHPDTYTLMVTDVSNGCTASTTVVVGAKDNYNGSTDGNWRPPFYLHEKIVLTAGMNMPFEKQVLPLLPDKKKYSPPHKMKKGQYFRTVP